MKKALFIGLALLLVSRAFPVHAETVTATTKACATSSSTAVAASASRSLITVQNNSDTAIWVDFDQAAVVGTSLQLLPNGVGTLNYMRVEPGKYMWGMPTGIMTCIHNGTGTKDLTIREIK